MKSDYHVAEEFCQIKFFPSLYLKTHKDLFSSCFKIKINGL